MILVVLFSVSIVLLDVQAAHIQRNARSTNTVGCLNCYKTDESKINVHLVPHSHDDVGWLKTVDQYFYGLQQNIQKASVQDIITSVVEELSKSSDRRFIQVETAYLWRWFNSTDNDMKTKFKNLVNNGQIEIVNGAWSMNDEACTNYQSTIDQFTWGLRFINDTLGECGIPRIGWQIDPFGHSREQASIYAQLGFDGVFISRLDFKDREVRRSEKNINFAWQGSANLDNSVIFGGIFPTDWYGPPKGYCWDTTCHDSAVQDDPSHSNYNLEKLVNNFISLSKTYVGYSTSSHILVPMGGDFNYQDAQKNFDNMDKFIKGFKDHPEINVFYSTPSCFVKAVYDENPELKLKTDDFFPYSDKVHSYWTGYFTSRPNSKRFERVGHNILQVTKQLVALNGPEDSNYLENVDSLEYLRDTMGVLQHHDAITGTEKQHVANDYVHSLTHAIEVAEKPIGSIIGDLLRIDQNETLDFTLNLSSCLLANVSVCSVSQSSERFLVAVYNPLAWEVTHYVRLPVENTTYLVEGPDGEVNYDIVSPIPYFYSKSNIDSSDSEIVFPAKDVPPMGIKIFYVSKIIDSSENEIPQVTTEDETYYFGNENIGFQIDNETNLLKSVTMNGKSVQMTQNFYYYISETAANPSGAYIFHPRNSYASDFVGDVENAGIVRTNDIEEFHQLWNVDKASISQIIRVYKTENYIEFDWLVGGINVDDNVGREIITRYTVQDFQNENIFYTDSNGREMLKRELNTRPDYTYDAKSDPIASNYYPVTSRIVIKDEDDDLEVAILTDRSQGGSSLEDGQIELMLHRRILRDDHLGVEEKLNEAEFGHGVYARGSHYLLIGPTSKVNSDGKTSAAQQRILSQKKLLQPWIGVANADSDSLSFENIKEKLELSYSALSKSLPENVNILTFEPWKDNTFLLRLEHIFEKEDDSDLSNVATVNITDLFDKYTIKGIAETTLGANEWLKYYQLRPKYNWNTVGEKLPVIYPVNDDLEGEVTLTPMQIRTFIISLEEFDLPDIPVTTGRPDVTDSPDAATSVFASYTFFTMIVITTVVHLLC